MNHTEPSLQDWKELYAAAGKFRSMGCWKWMEDSEIFGVLDPLTGEVGYCSIMGMLGQLHGLAIYPGSEGLDCLLRLLSGDLSHEDALFAQKCLLVSFESKRALDDQDLRAINQLNLQLKGRLAWPVFRNHTPGLYPWFIDRHEAHFLKSALEQATEVARLAKADKRLLIAFLKEGRYLVRTPRRNDEAGPWENSYLKPKSLRKRLRRLQPAGRIPADRLEQLKAKGARRDGVWEADLRYAPVPMREHQERPYFPYLAMIVDQQRGLVLGATMIAPAVHADGFQTFLVETLEQAETMPVQIWVAPGETLDLLKPLATALKIQVKTGKQLRGVEAARNSFMEFLQRR